MSRLIFFLSFVLVVFGCAGSGASGEYSGKNYLPTESEVRGFNFRQYTEEGFLITPQSYEQPYQSVGVIQVTVWPEMRKLPETTNTGEVTETEWVQTTTLSLNAAVDSLYQRARGMGADAIINFESARVTERVENATRVGVQARGFAIDRTSN